MEVPSPVPELAPLSGQGPPEPPAIPGARPGALLAALQVDNPLLSRVEESRVGDDLSVAGGQKSRHPHVDPDLAASGWQRHRLHLRDHDHVPAATFPLELQRLYPTGHRPMLADLDPSYRLEGRIRPAATIGRFPLGAVPNDEQHLVEALARLETWVSDRPLLGLLASTSLLPTLLGAPHALVISREHHVETAERLLLGGEGVAALPVRVGGADLLELRRLVAVRNAHLGHAPGLTALLESGVVQIAGVGQQPHRPDVLGTCRIGAQFVRASHSRLCSCPEVRWRVPGRRPYLRSGAMRIVNSDRGTIHRSYRCSRIPRRRNQAVTLGGS